MLSTMQDVPLLVSRILRHGSTVHGTAQVTTWTGEPEPRRRSFAEIGARSAQLAHALRDELGVGPGGVVATLMWNNAEHQEAYLGVPAMGAVLHTLNIRLPTHQLSWIINHAPDEVVLVNGTLLPLLASVLPDCSTVRHVVVVGPGDRSVLDGCRPAVHDYEELLAGRPTDYDWPLLDERQPAALCYSSGTTGDPKGVVYSHRSVYLHSMQVNTRESFGLSWQEKVLPVVPMFHVNAWGLPHAAFMAGAALLMPDRFLQPAALATMIVTERPTVAGAVPSIWTGLLAELDADPRDVTCLQQAIVGGSACPPALMRAFQERHGMRVVHGWGMTEMSPLGCVSHPPAGVTAETEWGYREKQGRFPAGVEARLVGPDGAVMPHDGTATGELEVRGPWVASAYHGGADAGLDQPEDKFRDGWLRTGDIGTITPDGYLYLTDRAKDVIKSGGEWISSVELENRLMGHPEVAEAAVVAVADERWGERPLATVVLREGATVDFAALRTFLADYVAKWQLPERWALVESIPKTSVGKFDKKVIRRSYLDGELDVATLD